MRQLQQRGLIQFVHVATDAELSDLIGTDRVNAEDLIKAADDGSEFDWLDVTGELLKIQCSYLPPRQAAVAVRYRGYWFYIDDTDLHSKSTFALLRQLFSLQAGQFTGAAPVLTLPVGG